MAAIDEVRGYLARLREEGSVRTDLPPRVEEEYYNPIECAPREKIEGLRDKHLRHIVNWAYKYSQFYRKLWDEAGVKPDDIQGYDDLEKLPVWRKAQQRQDEAEHPLFGSRAVKELIPYVPLIFRSTGTTGLPTMLLWLPEDFDAFTETRGRWFYAAGCRTGGAFVNFTPSARGQMTPRVMELAARTTGLIYYDEEVSGYQSDPQASASFIFKLGEFYKPLCTFMAPEFLLTLAQQFKKMDKESPFDVVLVGGTPLSPRLRQELHMFYKKIKGFSSGSGGLEGGVLSECLFSAEKGIGHYHECGDLLVHEVVKPGTQERVAEGERGELVVTIFFNHTLPVIRFGVEDVFENSSTTQTCGCGRTAKRWLKPCPGRLKDIFKVRGRELMPWDVELVIGEIPDTTMIYQIFLDGWDMDKLKVKIETSRELPNPEYEREAKTILENKLNIPTEVELIPAGTISPSPGGYKVMKIVDKRPKKV